MFQPCAVWRSCSDAEGRVAIREVKKWCYMQHLAVSSGVWPLRHKGDVLQSKDRVCGCCWLAAAWMCSHGRTLWCTKPWSAFPQEPQPVQVPRPALVRHPLWLLECLEGVSGLGNSWAASPWGLEEYPGKALNPALLLCAYFWAFDAGNYWKWDSGLAKSLGWSNMPFLCS